MTAKLWAPTTVLHIKQPLSTKDESFKSVK